ncbi:Histidine kinase [Pseudomonas amygdali pv. mori]|uniref:Histidine kinase n=3 Tax=Pseudomonas amygdali TaxID=47877 RepID=A0A0P9VEP4_PSEA0|nr:Histidine kinase [Pseudomonas amygdali pv. mori]
MNIMFSKLSISQKLYFSFVAIVVLIAVLVFSAYRGFEQVEDATNSNVHTYQVLSDAQLALEQLINIETGMRGFVIASKDAFLEPLLAGEKRFTEELDSLKRLTADNPEQQRRLASLGETQKRWLDEDIHPIIALRRDLTARNMSDDELDNRITSGADKAKMDSMRALLAEISATENKLLVERTQSMLDAKHFAIMILMCGGLAAALLSAILATALGRSTTARLQLAIDAATAIANGKLDTVIDTSSHDELPKAFDRMQNRLREMIQQISQAANQLVLAVQQISGASEQLSGAIQEQSTSASMMAATIEELTVSIHHVSENADEAHQLASRSGQQSKDGAQVIENTLSSMNGIAKTVQLSSTQVAGLGQHSEHISSIISVIQGIADQTNLLALNAAIEAARAGEQGRGFAVVADEVRALAHRTQTSTQEIEQMIQGIQKNSNEAVQSMKQSNAETDATLLIAQQAGIAIKDITASISHINERNLMIATASEQQAHVARSVDENLVSIRDLSAQSSSASSQTSTASQELSRLAVDLNRMVSKFSI